MHCSLLLLFTFSLFSLYLAAPVAVAVPETIASALTSRAAAGTATFYEPGLGACEKVNSASDMIAAVAIGRGKGECFKSIRVSCGSKSVDVEIVDLCQSCVSFSPLSFGRICG